MAIKKSELYSSLWASCDELRGGMDASQYKDYVLVLLFIKYISDKYAGVKFAPIDVPKGASFADMVALKNKQEDSDLQPESQPESLELRVLSSLKAMPLSKVEISNMLGQREISGHLNKSFRLMLACRTIAYTIPDKPNSRLQKYRLTPKGLAILKKRKS